MGRGVSSYPPGIRARGPFFSRGPPGELGLPEDSELRGPGRRVLRDRQPPFPGPSTDREWGEPGEPSGVARCRGPRPWSHSGVPTTSPTRPTRTGPTSGPGRVSDGRSPGVVLTIRVIVGSTGIRPRRPSRSHPGNHCRWALTLGSGRVRTQEEGRDRGWNKDTYIISGNSS